MQLRWVAAIALWSLLIGPVIGPPLPRPSDSASANAPPPGKTSPAAVQKARR